jgi:DNA invertase Pin-like site-specific DNA recombinase
MTAQPVAYIRRSVARRGDPGDVSREFQSDKVRALASGDGPRLRIIDQDWGRSAATDKTDKRRAFLALLGEIERGEVSTLYAFSADRLARSVRWAAQLLDACQQTGTTIVTGEGRFAPGDTGAAMLFQMLAVMNENTLRGMEEKAKASVETRKGKGDLIGQRPYGEVRTRKDGVVVGGDEDAAMIVATFREAGSYFTAARLLNERGVPSRNGRQWYPRTVQRIVNRTDKATVPPGHRRGVRTFGSRLFSGLLTCHCGATMGQTVGEGGRPMYRCPNGVADKTHSRPYMVTEKKLLDAMKNEASHLRIPADQVELAAASIDALNALETRRERVRNLYIEGMIDEADRDRRWAAIDEDADFQRAMAHVEDIPAKIDWTWPPDKLNAVLRVLWERVTVGPDLMPVQFRWRVPEWRS